MRRFDTVTVPTTQEQDHNKGNSIWKNGKCVALVEGRQTVVYLLHEDEHTIDEHGEEQIITKAVEVRMDSPYNLGKLLHIVRNNTRKLIEEYDSSSDVNSFFLNNERMWLDKSTRSGLMLRLNAEYAAGKENTVLWYNGRSISLPVSTAIEMLNRLEIYASQCYDKTQDHLSTVSSMTDPEDILRYDYTKGYPEMIHF